MSLILNNWALNFKLASSADVWAASWENQKCGFRTGLSQTELYKHRSRLEAWNFGFKKKRNCTIRVAKTKALISFAVTAKLICVFVFAYADCWFSHEMARISLLIPNLVRKKDWLSQDAVQSLIQNSKLWHGNFFVHLKHFECEKTNNLGFQ